MMSQDCVTITIRSTIKKIDEITLRCPVNWTVFQLKMFVAINHRQGQDYFKPEKTQFYHVGKTLNDDDTIAVALKSANAKQSYTLIAKFSAAADADNASKNNEEDVDKTNILDDYNKLFQSLEQRICTTTNIKDLDAFSKLPVMMPTLSRQIAKMQAQGDENFLNGQQDAAANAGNDDQDENNEHQYIIKLVIRILVIFFLFRSHFQGTLFYIFLAVLGIYFLIKLNQKRGRQRLQQRQQQQQQQNQPRPVAPNADGQAQPQGQPQNPNQPAQAEDPNLNVRQPTLLNKLKELVITFVSSLYPSWDLNVYIEDNPVAQPPEVAPENQEQQQEAPVAAENNAEANNAVNTDAPEVQAQEPVGEQSAESSQPNKEINEDKQPVEDLKKDEEEVGLLSRTEDKDEPKEGNI